MAPRNATRRPGGGVSAVTCSLAKTSTTENSIAPVNGQAITLPTLAETRARLLKVIRQKPAPVINRAPDAVRIPLALAPNTLIARLLDVTPRAVMYWRRGERRPRWRHERKLSGLRFLIRRAGS